MMKWLNWISRLFGHVTDGFRMAVRIKSLETQLNEALDLTKLRNDTVRHYKEENTRLKETIGDLKEKSKKATTEDQNLLERLKELMLERPAKNWGEVEEAVQRLGASHQAVDQAVTTVTEAHDRTTRIMESLPIDFMNYRDADDE